MIVEFLTENWKFFATAGLILLEVIILLISKKRPQILDNSLISKLAVWIGEAESKFTVGSDKLKYVMDKARESLGDLYDAKVIRSTIEWLLTLPHKKEK